MKGALSKTAPTSNPKNKNQVAYEKLLQNIEKQKAFLSNMEKGLTIAQANIKGKLQPLTDEYTVYFREYLIRLDALVQEIGISTTVKNWFFPFMEEELLGLLDDLGFQDKALAALYEKYAHSSINDYKDSDDFQETAAALSELLGFEVDMQEVLEKGESQFVADHDEEIKRRLHEKMHSEHASQENQQTNRKKTAKQLAAEKKAEEENKFLTKDARAIYMRLIKKMHPDLEKDDQQRIIKTEITKKVTEAYQKNDFFTLLKLQIEHIEEGESDAEFLADDMLKRYNKILKKQLEEMQAYIRDRHFMHGSMIEDFLDKNGNFSEQKFKAQHREINTQIRDLQGDIMSSYNKPKTWFKEKLKAIKLDQQERMFEDAFFNLFGDGKF